MDLIRLNLQQLLGGDLPLKLPSMERWSTPSWPPWTSRTSRRPSASWSLLRRGRSPWLCPRWRREEAAPFCNPYQVTSWQIFTSTANLYLRKFDTESLGEYMMTRLVTNSGLFCLINFLPDLYLSNKHFTKHCASFQQKLLHCRNITSWRKLYALTNSEKHSLNQDMF